VINNFFSFVHKYIMGTADGLSPTEDDL